ncbi:MAG: hypothetical protein ACKOAG_12645, partial [Candidatus Kapaibacterium sp.]
MPRDGRGDERTLVLHGEAGWRPHDKTIVHPAGASSRTKLGSGGEEAIAGNLRGRIIGGLDEIRRHLSIFEWFHDGN